MSLYVYFTQHLHPIGLQSPAPSLVDLALIYTAFWNRFYPPRSSASLCQPRHCLFILQCFMLYTFPSLPHRMASFLGPDVTENFFLPRFASLCSDSLFHVRKVCAANIGKTKTSKSRMMTPIMRVSDDCQVVIGWTSNRRTGAGAGCSVDDGIYVMTSGTMN